MRKAAENAVWRGVPAEEIFKAMGNGARVRMVEALMERECCVAELVTVAGLGWSTVSRHLSVLKAAGIVAERRAGVQVYYHLGLKSVGNFIRYLKDARFRQRVEQFLKSEGMQNEV